MRVAGQMMVTSAALAAVAAIGAPPATAAMRECPHRLGSHQSLVDAGGAVAQDWTLTDLHASTDTTPGYPLTGHLWEATATVRAVSGMVTPVIPNFAAMGADHRTYPVLWQLASPTGLSAATLTEGQTSTGKVYFDVTGTNPAAVVYNTGGPKPAMMWCDMAAMAPMMAMSMTDCPNCGPNCNCCDGKC